MTIINGGLINCGGAASSSSNSLALSDGLACFTGSFSGVTTTSISHNLDSSNLVVEFKDQTGNLLIPDTWSITNSNVIEAEFSPAATGDVTIIACIESGLAPITGGVTTIEGLSGIVDLDSPNNSIVITTSGQVINLNAIFTPASGAVLEQKCRDITILSGLIGTGGGGGVASVNNISGIVTLVSTNNGLQIGVNGQDIEFTPLFTYTSGQIIDQHSQDLLHLSGLILPDSGQTSINGVSGVTTLDSPDDSVNINVNGQSIELTTPTSGAPSGASYLLKEYNDNDHLVDARILSATSGIRLVDQGARSTSGLVATLDFDNEPSLNQVVKWNGQRLIWANDNSGGGGGGGQTSINGLSGVVQITSPDNTILIGSSGQSIELSGLFTQASGAVLEQKCDDLITLSGTVDGVNTRLISLSGLTDGLPRTQTSIEGLSGVVDLEALDGTMVITVDGQTIQLSGLFNPGSGEILEQHGRDINSVSGVAYSNSGVIQQRIDERRWQGVVSGLELSVNSTNSGLFDVAPGIAYISGIRIVTPLQSGIDPEFLPGSGACGQQTAFVGLTISGTITSSIDAVYGHEAQGNIIDLGMVSPFDPASANSGLIDLVHTERQEILDVDYNRISWVEFAVGAVVSSGIITSDNGSLTLAVSEGVFYDRHQNRQVHDLDQPIDFFEIYSDAAGNRIVQNDLQTTVRNTEYDGGTGLVNITGNRFVTHSLWFDVIRDIHYMVISTDQYSSLQLAQDAPIDPGCIIDFANIIPIAKVVIKRNQTAFSGDTGRIVDVRPIIGARTNPGTLVTTATTLQQAYENSAADAEITLQEEQGGLTIADNAVPLVTNGTHLFEVHNSDESIEFFQVTGSGMWAPSGVFGHKVGIGEAFPQGSEARCTLDVSGMICTSGLEVVGSRPTLSGVGLATLADIIDTQMTLNGLSGAVTIDAVNNGINVNVNGQSIELSTLFTYTSGQIIDQHTQDVLTLSGLILADTGQTSINGLSGALSLTSPDGSILIGDSPQTLELSGLFTAASGAVLQQKCADIDTLSGLILPDAGQTSINGESGVISLVAGSGITVVVTAEGDPSEITISALFTSASGEILEQKCRDIDTLSGLILPDTGQTSINGISGAISLGSPDDSINVNVNGQTIELTTPTSGAPSGASYLLRDYNDNDHLVDARILSATSGIRLLDRGARSGSGLVITLDFQDEPNVSDELTWNGSGLEWLPKTTINGLEGAVNLITGNDGLTINAADPNITLTTLFTAASGSIVDEKCAEIASLSGTVTGLPEKVALDFTATSGTSFVMYHGLNTENFTWNMWEKDDGGISIQNYVFPATLRPSGVDYVEVGLASAMVGTLIIVG